MKRAFVLRSTTDKHGKLLAIDSFGNLLRNISNLFQIPLEDVRLFTENGFEIEDVRVIRDDDRLYLSEPQNDANNFDHAVSEIITLNVGGKNFSTTRSTLAKEPQSMLARMFADDQNVYLMHPSWTDQSGAFLIDRSSQYFEPILNYLRHGEVILDRGINPKGVMEEALFYGVDSMYPQIQVLIDQYEANSIDDSHALNRMDVVRSIIMTPTVSELRFQGVNLAGANLNKLDLRYINFKYACLSRCNLGNANLSYCCLERADLSYANLEGAQLLGVKALCANMEGAYLKSCNMEDPAGSRAILEGVNLKGANLEGSNMAGVNLRVATLKNANLQNCDLRTAVLAGADLECCDLSGSDLHEANLRGANLKDAAFELMLTPLHMSQTIR